MLNDNELCTGHAFHERSLMLYFNFYDFVSSYCKNGPLAEPVYQVVDK